MAKKKTSLIRSPDFKTIYAVGAIGTWTPYDFRINFYSEKVVEDEEEAYVNDTQVILSPKATKEFAFWLLQNVKEYESTYGEPISTEDVKESEGVEKTFKGDFKSTLRDDIKTEVMSELRRYLKKTLPEFKKDLKVIPTPELQKDLKKVLKADLKQDLQKDMRPDLRKDLKRVLKADLKQDLREDLKKDIREELKRDLHAISVSPQKLKPKPKSTTKGPVKKQTSNKNKTGKTTKKLESKKK
jgi:hypothetical protein